MECFFHKVNSPSKREFLFHKLNFFADGEMLVRYKF